VTRTRCVGTNLLQTGGYLATASSTRLALRDDPVSLTGTGTAAFLCSPYCQTPLSQSGKGCPAQTRPLQRKHPQSLHPCPPQPHAPAGSPLPAGSCGRAAAGRFLELVPLASLLPDRASGLQLWLGIPLSGKKNPPLIAGTQMAHRGPSAAALTCHITQEVMGVKVPRCGVPSQQVVWRTLWPLRDIDTPSSPGGTRVLQHLCLGPERIQR